MSYSLLQKLYDGSQTLGNGLTTLENGLTTLNNGLSDGAKKAEATTLTTTSKNMFASPVETVETQVSTISNNGSAMAAYMMCAGMWVAGLAFCVLIAVEKDPERIKKRRSLKWQRILHMVIFSSGSGAILVALLMLINGMQPLYVSRTFALAIMTAFTFTCIIYFFNVLLGKVGSFLLIVLLVLQLGSAGGTYPLDLSPSIFRTLKPFFPFSYAVDGFRMTIATGESITSVMLILGAFALVFATLSVITVIVKVHSKKEHHFSFSALMEEAFS